MRRLGKFGMLFLVAILAVGAITAAGAYFSSSQTVANAEFQAGTLTLDTPVVVTWTAPTNWAPGDTAELEIKLHNSGTIDAKYLGIDWTNPQGYVPFAGVIEITEMKEWVYGVGWIDDLDTGGQNYQGCVKDGTDPFTLRELMESYFGTEPSATDPGGWDLNEFSWWVSHVTDAISGYGYDVIPSGTPALAAGQDYYMKLGFKFLESANDDYQGKTFSFDISFFACQDLSQVD